MLKLDLGAGNIKRAGFTSVDLYDEEADIRADLTTLPFGNDSADEIVCYQVIEHVHYAQSQQVLEEMYRILCSGGTAIVETPDIEVIAKRIIDTGDISENTIHNLVGQYYRPHDKDRYEDWYHNAASIHRNPWNFRRLAELATAVGFTVERLDKEDMVYQYDENLAVRLTK
jgi:predicted SAM-dependent methyltransferase